MSRAICIASQFSRPFLANGPVTGSKTPMRIGAWADAEKPLNGKAANAAIASNDRNFNLMKISHVSQS
jgi:hypothetical protein